MGTPWDTARRQHLANARVAVQAQDWVQAWPSCPFNKKVPAWQPAQRGGAGVWQLVMQLTCYLFFSRQTKSLKTSRKTASPTPGIASGLLHERFCPPATCYSIAKGHMQVLSRNTGPDPQCLLCHPGLETDLLVLHVLGLFLFCYFVFYSSPHFTPAFSASGLGPRWQKLKKFRREHTWQTGLPSPTKQTKLKAIPTSQASHPKDNTNRNNLASNSKHPLLKGVWLGFLQQKR